VFRSSLLVAGSVVAVLAVLVSSAAGSTTPRASGASYPVTIVTASGKVTVKSQPRRIISLSPTATETLFAIGAGSQVVAVDDQSDYPKTAPKTTLSGYTPNVEAIASYRPDLVIASYDPKGLVSALNRLGIPVYHELTPDFYSASSKSFVGKVYTALGLKNIADAADSGGTGYPQLSAEYIVASSPDLIVLADSVCCGQKPSTVAARPGWDRVKAVRSGSIVRIDDSIASRWGPRLVSFFRAMSLALARL
jgi:iron complex transport system substrate-binding protein